MPPKGAGKEKAAIEEEDEILQAVILADSFNSRFGPLTMDLPRVCIISIMPGVGSLIQMLGITVPSSYWTFEALASAGVQQVYVFCSSHSGLIRQAIDASPWSRPSSGLKIIPISSREARSVGDALREIDTKQIISSDFVLVSGDIISNIRIDEVVKEHRERRKISKDAIMTTVVREVGPRDRPHFIWDKTRIGADCIIEESIIGGHVRILDGSVIRRGCLVGQNVTLGPNATLDKFQRVSRHPPAANEDEDWDEEEEERKEEAEREDDGDETDEDKSIIMSVTGTESSAVSVEHSPDGAEGDAEDIESPLNIKRGRIGDHGSDVEYEESDVSDLDTVASSPMGSPLSASSATSAGLISNIPNISLDSSADFLSECRQSLDRAYQEGHSIDNAAIELKTLRMASNVPLKQVAESIVSFLVGKIELVDAPAAQRGKVGAVVERWGPLLTSIGWDDAAETISLLQRYCALNVKYQKIFGLVLASFYNDDIVEFDDIKTWYGRNLTLKKQGLDPQDPIGASLEDTMQQAMKLIQQIHTLEQEDDDEEESDDDDEEAKPQPSGEVQVLQQFRLRILVDFFQRK
ncbi:hypothetical protein M407DRAFT_6891 [Tulasnella calospora MUT 4182]|uniref:Translation initiation factor eIF2B subunit epsilon n=1 Tax=Tulasnella calospora MUT 4182 TaxID=1051891 RepID=A0A0C3L2Z7_9AGAM|nr:hypothetical protein M407DRAFT_6891 [Tulasnella calospora MUT 4182]